jgi:hypothetical protein
MAGYSAKPLYQKLGIKAGMTIYIVGAPPDYWSQLGRVPTVVQVRKLRPPLDFAQLFVTSRAVLQAEFARYADALAPNGMFWVSWPKQAARARVGTDLSEDVVREIALAHGLVDVKVCAVDEVWSGLKLVRRLKDRA